VKAVSRRWSVVSLGLWAMLFALCSAAQAQQEKKIARIGFLSQSAVAGATLEAFLKGLHDLGYVEGKSIIIEYRNAKGDPDRLPTLASDLVGLKVDLNVVVGGEATLAAKNASRVIPIVMTVASDPVRTGLIASLARPGGNVTGLSSVGPEASAKRLELLKEVVPGVSRLAILAYTANPAYTLQLKEVEEAAKELRLNIQILEVQEPRDLDAAFESAKKGRAGAVSAITSAFLSAHRNTLVKIAQRSKLPVIYSNSAFAEIGGLMSYGPDVVDNFRRAATYVDKILKGAKPADLPVEQPRKFEFVINLKTAKQIGLTISPNVLARANKVIR
jgi:putative ABC transport system substrate-binding protein